MISHELSNTPILDEIHKVIIMFSNNLTIQTFTHYRTHPKEQQVIHHEYGVSWLCCVIHR